MRPTLLALAASASLAAFAPAHADITVYQDDGFQGRSVTTQTPVNDLRRRGFNDRASSVVVTGQPWELCDSAEYAGNCRVLRPGQYPSLSAMGLNDRISSMRAVGRNARITDDRYGPQPVVAQDYRRRKSERLYEARVTSSRAVYGNPGQRCWMEREQVPSGGGNARVPGAILGGVIGGILGHQIGGGTGRDIATVGGVVAGAAVGANVGGRQGGGTSEREVQRCSGSPGAATPTYWDVTYNHRGQEHRVQLTAAPGPTVTVNRQGEPRA